MLYLNSFHLQVEEAKSPYLRPQGVQNAGAALQTLHTASPLLCPGALAGNAASGIQAGCFPAAPEQSAPAAHCSASIAPKAVFKQCKDTARSQQGTGVLVQI